MKLLFDLFLTFAKIGLFTFGGGYAMLPLFERVCVEKKHWITQEEMLDMTLIAESTPGPVAINIATYVGHRQKGVAGALCATLGMVTPSFVLLFLISLYFERFVHIKWVAGAFWGIKIAVGILICDAALRLFKKVKEKNAMCVIILIAAALAILLIDIFSVHISSVVLIVASAFIGWLVYRIRAGRGQEK
ncbi:MAG: chromate transporter [Clostridia bacterium]|nr:chromate transporter [Clostridia bacterium]